MCINAMVMHMPTPWSGGHGHRIRRRTAATAARVERPTEQSTSCDPAGSGRNRGSGGWRGTSPRSSPSLEECRAASGRRRRIVAGGA